jgi:hypothetical protein
MQCQGYVYAQLRLIQIGMFHAGVASYFNESRFIASRLMIWLQHNCTKTPRYMSRGEYAKC